METNRIRTTTEITADLTAKGGWTAEQVEGAIFQLYGDSAMRPTQWTELDILDIAAELAR